MSTPLNSSSPPPLPQPQIESKTEKGSKFFFFGLLLYIIFQIIMMAILFASQGLISDLASFEEGDDPEELEGAMGFVGAVCGIMIILFIGLILILMGLIFFYSGRAEFGEKHAKDAQTGIFLLITGFVVGMVGSFVGIVLSSNTGLALGINYTIAIIGSAMYSIGFIYMLRKLLDQQGNFYLKIGAMLLIIFTIVNAVFAAVAIARQDELPTFSANSITIGLVFNLISVIPWAIFCFAFLNAWKRIQRGIIQPVFIPYPGMPQYPPYPPYPGYPPPMPMPGAPPPRPFTGPPGKPNACPSCGYILDFPVPECPKCGYSFDEKPK
ncbi:DUF973 family protein [[Eubacterium] cellulosolvens]